MSAAVLPTRDVNPKVSEPFAAGVSDSPPRPLPASSKHDVVSLLYVATVVRPEGGVTPLAELIDRIRRGDSIVLNNEGFWEAVKKVLRAVCDFLGISWQGTLDPTPLDGTFESRSTIHQAIRKLLGYEREDDLRLADFVVEYLTTLETARHWTKGVGEASFQNGAEQQREIERLLQAVFERLAPHKLAENSALHLTEMIEEKRACRQAVRTASKGEKAELEKKLSAIEAKLRAAKKKAAAEVCELKLKRHALAFQDRERQQFHILQRRSNPNYVRDKLWLEESVRKWKLKLHPPLDPTKATSDAKKMEDLLSYPELLKLLRKDPTARETLYKFLFRNMSGTCPDAVHIATQFPATSEEITSCYLDKYDGRLGNLLSFSERVERSAGPKVSIMKQVRFKMNGQDISLHDRAHRVDFGKGYSRTVHEILHSFAIQNEEIGELGCIQEKGIVLLHPIRVNFANADWYQEIPVYETLNEAEVHERYGRLPEDAFLVIKASRQHKSSFGVHVRDTHAWLQVVMKDEKEKGRYKVYPFGKYADPMPKGFFQTISFIFGTQLGVLRMDIGEHFTHREQTQVVLDASKAQALRVFDRLKDDLAKEQTCDIVFQPQADNCASWVRSTIDYALQDTPEVTAKLKDLYEVDWLECDTGSGLLGSVQYVAKNISSSAGAVLRLAVSFLFGAGLGFTTTSRGTLRLITDPQFLSGKTFVPGQLFRQRERLNAELLPSVSR